MSLPKAVQDISDLKVSVAGAQSTADAAKTAADAAQTATQSLDMGKAASGILALARGGTGNATGLASTATSLATARTVRTDLASTSTASFNGTANITPGVTGTLPIGNGGTGNTTGLAASATKLATARTITLAGSVSGTASFDGSANVTIATTGGGVSVSRADQVLSSALSAGTSVTVPSYPVGSSKLAVYMDGILCKIGTSQANGSYKEIGTAGNASTTISFWDALPAGTEITAIVTA